MAFRSNRRLLVLGRQLEAGRVAGGAVSPGDHAASLPSMPITFNYFNLDRFQAEHGPSARPCYGDLSSDDPEVTRQNKAKHSFSYFMGFERPVHDARTLAGSISLDEQGFCIRPSPTKMTSPDFYTREVVEQVYLPECAEFLKQVTGASRVLCFDYIVRNADLNKKGGKAAGYAENRPHNDHTLVSGPRRTRELLGEDSVNGEVLNYRFALMNVWRRWDGGNHHPLACCAYETLDYENDMVAQDLVYRHRTGETYTVRPSEKHRYYWFSDMKKDEAIVLKIYDSDPKVARGSLHTGFDNPAAPQSPCRESMEVRCVVLFAPEELASRASLRGEKVATNVQGGVMGPTGHDSTTYHPGATSRAK